jgi:hypothetical protein
MFRVQREHPAMRDREIARLLGRANLHDQPFATQPLVVLRQPSPRHFGQLRHPPPLERVGRALAHQETL